MTDTLASFSALLRHALGERVAADARSFLDMLADEAVMEFPYTLPGMPARLDGKAAIARHLDTLGNLIAFDGMGEPIVHPAADPDLVFIEFAGFGRGVATGEPYEQNYISVVRTADGRIVHYRDYWNPLAVLRATEGQAFVKALTGKAGGHD